MSRFSQVAATSAVVIIMCAHQDAWAQQQFPNDQHDAGVVRIVSHVQPAETAPGLIPDAQEAKPIQSVSQTKAFKASKVRYHHASKLGPATGMPGPCYPQINAPLYPSPQPMTPSYVGGTMITNQALSPHEMLYPHQYKALYGPYYYKVKGSWYLTPFGVRSHDRWELQGTSVSVKYRSHYKPFSLFFPPSRTTP